jgi:dTDP-4-dehydrorhamnose reductase
MKILITGANGLLGQELVKQLIQDGSSTIVATSKGICRLPEEVASKVTYLDLDITFGQEVAEVLASVKPDCIIHAAAMTQVDDCENNKQHCYNTNVGATRFLIDGAKVRQCRFIYISTDFVFDGLSGPYSEDDVPAPVNYYGSTKLAAENAVKESELNWNIIRTVLVYGKSTGGTRSNLVTWVKKSLEEGRNIKVVCDQWRTPTFVEDLAKGIRLVNNKAINGIYHISGKDLLTPYDMAIKTAAVLQLNQDLIEKVDASNFNQCGERPKKTGFTIEKARKELGFEPLSFQESLEKIFDKKVTTVNP